MTENGVNTFTKAQLLTLSNLQHEQKSLQDISSKIRDDISILKKEIHDLRLEKQWCFDSEGKRITETPEEESLRICRLTEQHPGSKNDVISALKKKKTMLQMEVSENEEKLKKKRNMQLHLT